MIVHLFPKSKFTEPFIEFIVRNFNSADHKFVLYTNGPHDITEECFHREQVYDLDNYNFAWLYRELNVADKIIFHNLSVTVDVLVFFFQHRKLLKKSAWFIWGSDLYCFRDKRKGIAAHTVELLRKSMIQKIPMFITWIPADCRLADLWYNTNSIHMPVAYYDKELVDALHEQDAIEQIKSQTLRILLGNSATKTNHHKEMLDFLNQWKEEDIEIYAPLSYGDSIYGDEIQQIGENCFGCKFKALRDYMSRREYFSLLNEMDIVIFNHDRQQALGNIVALLYLGKKIYLRNTTTMWETLVDDMGFTLYTIEELKKSTLSELMYMDDEVARKNRQIAQKHYDLKERINEWENVFSYDLNV